MKKLLLALVVLLGLPGMSEAAYAPLPISAEDTAHTGGENILRQGCRRIDTAASSAGSSGDWATQDCDANGRAWVHTELPTAATLADATANPSLSGISAYMMCFNGTTWDRCIASPNVAHDADASGANPLLIGGYASATAPGNVSADLNAVRAWFLRNGAQVTANIDPCSQKPKIFVPISITTSTALFTGTASNRTYVCSIHVVTATAQNVALVSGTTPICSTSTGPMTGGTTAATGWNFAANGGIVLGNGAATVAKSDTDGDGICILMSSTGQLSGTLSYVVAPN
jgi:hypothetical protein